MPGEHGFCLLTQESLEALKAKIKTLETENASLRASTAQAQASAAQAQGDQDQGNSGRSQSQMVMDALDDVWSNLGNTGAWSEVVGG